MLEERKGEERARDSHNLEETQNSGYTQVNSKVEIWTASKPRGWRI